MARQALEIRKALQQLLLNQTDAEDRVYASRSEPRLSSDLPAIVLYTRTRSSELLEDSPRTYKHSYRVAIELEVETGADGFPDEVCDELAEQVEQILFRNPTLDVDGDQQWGCVPVEDEVEYSSEGRLLVCAMRLTWLFTLSQAAPEEAEGSTYPFRTVGTSYNLTDVAPNGELEATDETELPQQ